MKEEGVASVGHAGSFPDQPWSSDNLDWLDHFGGTDYGEADPLQLAFSQLITCSSSARNVLQ